MLKEGFTLTAEQLGKLMSQAVKDGLAEVRWQPGLSNPAGLPQTAPDVRQLAANGGRLVTAEELEKLLPDLLKDYVAPPAEVAADDDTAPVAQMQQAVGAPLAKAIASMDRLGQGKFEPGSVIVGAGAGILTAELIDGFIAPQKVDAATGAVSVNFTNVLAKAGAAAVGAMYGPQLVGNRAPKYYVGALLVSIAGQILPIDEWIGKLVAWLKKKFKKDDPPAASVGQTVVERAAANNGMSPAEWARYQLALQNSENASSGSMGQLGATPIYGPNGSRPEDRTRAALLN